MIVIDEKLWFAKINELHHGHTTQPLYQESFASRFLVFVAISGNSDDAKQLVGTSELSLCRNPIYNLCHVIFSLSLPFWVILRTPPVIGQIRRVMSSFPTASEIIVLELIGRVAKDQ
jgi:hypothetical protein